jgi:8-oxo-dGTP pyrophosphatase MutT (NUDIX family)
MVRSFDDTTRRNIAELCAGFARVASDDAAPALKRAAVAIALTRAEAGEGTAFLLTRRAASLRAHSAQWALPGGRCDPGETQAQSALRELHEELGIALGECDVLGLLDDYPTRSGYLITPVVVWVSTRAEIVPNPAEVASVHHIALEQIEQDDAFSFTRIPESTRRVIRFRLDGQHIHAPTAALIYQFSEVLAGRATRVAELEQPVFAWK